MSTYTQIACHIVFSPKRHMPVIRADHENDLYEIITETIHQFRSIVYRINGMPDHLHILCSIHPTISLSEFVKGIKICSSEAIKKNNLFSGFDHWQRGYAAFTVSYDRINAVIEYIKHQKEHHARVSYEDEIRKMLKESGVSFEEKYLFE
ncbi:MAG: IS200/IS605 family transposase [Bacteroidota bacterium]